MSYIWLFFLGASLVCGVLTDQVSGLSGAAMQGAQQGAELCLSLCGALCLWSGAARVMEKSGLMQKLSCVLSPFLSRIFPETCRGRRGARLSLRKFHGKPSGARQRSNADGRQLCTQNADAEPNARTRWK